MFGALHEFKFKFKQFINTFYKKNVVESSLSWRILNICLNKCFFLAKQTRATFLRIYHLQRCANFKKHQVTTRQYWGYVFFLFWIANSIPGVWMELKKYYPLVISVIRKFSTWTMQQWIKFRESLSFAQFSNESRTILKFIILKKSGMKVNWAKYCSSNAISYRTEQCSINEFAKIMSKLVSKKEIEQSNSFAVNF